MVEIQLMIREGEARVGEAIDGMGMGEWTMGKRVWWGMQG